MQSCSREMREGATVVAIAGYLPNPVNTRIFKSDDKTFTTLPEMGRESIRLQMTLSLSRIFLDFFIFRLERFLLRGQINCKSSTCKV